MATTPAAARANMTAAEWRLLLLLIVSIFINYVDCGSLSIAAPLIERELALSPTELGALLSAFLDVRGAAIVRDRGLAGGPVPRRVGAGRGLLSTLRKAAAAVGRELRLEPV